MTTLEGLTLATLYMAGGISALLFSHELATGLNAFSVKFYQWLPSLKKRIPLSRLAGTQTNYKSSLYYFRGLGILMLVGGTLMLGLVLLRR